MKMSPYNVVHVVQWILCIHATTYYNYATIYCNKHEIAVKKKQPVYGL